MPGRPGVAEDLAGEKPHAVRANRSLLTGCCQLPSAMTRPSQPMEMTLHLLPALALTILLAPAEAARAQAPEPGGPVLEVVTFRLLAEAKDAAFLTAAEATASPLRSQPGFLSRSLTRTPDGVWTDHVLWSSQATADAGAVAMMAEPAFAPFMALIDGPSVTMRHDPVVLRMD